MDPAQQSRAQILSSTQRRKEEPSVVGAATARRSLSPGTENTHARTLCAFATLRLCVGFCFVFFGLACSSPPPPADQAAPEPPLTGNTISGTAPRASGGFPSVVILEPETGGDYPIPSEPAVMDQYNTEFHPRLLLVRAGQTVQFRNSEDTLHNVHVIDTETRDTAFNIATPVTGAFEFVFEAPAVFDVSCGIHPSMAAFVVVTDSPYAAVAETDGAFTIEQVPPGRYTATVWNLDPSRRSSGSIVIDETTTALALDEVS